MTDVSIYVDVWRSLNGRFQQRLVDPRVDLLQAEWSPFRPTPWIMPLLTELTPWRQKLTQLERSVFNWSDTARVAFVADFPGELGQTCVCTYSQIILKQNRFVFSNFTYTGLSMDNYVPAGVTNASLQILEGQVELSIENGSRSILNVNDTATLPSSVMHTITTTSSIPASYMYTFVGLETTINSSSLHGSKEQSDVSLITPFVKSLALVGQSLLNLVFGVPLVAHK